MLVDAVSHSKDWQSTVIFMMQDDAQGTRDHVSAQRTDCFVIVPILLSARQARMLGEYVESGRSY